MILSNEIRHVVSRSDISGLFARQLGVIEPEVRVENFSSALVEYYTTFSSIRSALTEM